VGASGQAGKRKEKTWFGSGPKVVMGRLKAQQARLRLAGSARPAAQQAGSVLGLAGASWAGSG
jgi:hypothetical protein